MMVRKPISMILQLSAPGCCGQRSYFLFWFEIWISVFCPHFNNVDPSLSHQTMGLLICVWEKLAGRYCTVL